MNQSFFIMLIMTWNIYICISFGLSIILYLGEMIYGGFLIFTGIINCIMLIYKIVEFENQKEKLI